MGANEHLDQYIDRFMQLKRRATEMDGVMLSSRFVKGLIPSLGQLVNMAISGWSKSRRSSISRVIRITRRMVLHLPAGQVDTVTRGSTLVLKARDEGSSKWQRYARSNAGESSNALNVSVSECPFHEGQQLVNKFHDPASCPEFLKASEAMASLNGNKAGGVFAGNKKRLTELRSRGLYALDARTHSLRNTFAQCTIRPETMVILRSLALVPEAIRVARS